MTARLRCMRRSRCRGERKRCNVRPIDEDLHAGTPEVVDEFAREPFRAKTVDQQVSHDTAPRRALQGRADALSRRVALIDVGFQIDLVHGCVASGFQCREILAAALQ